MAKKKSTRTNRKIGTTPKINLRDLMFCDECKLFGYCKEKNAKLYDQMWEHRNSIQINQTFDLNSYTVKIPLRVEDKNRLSVYAAKHVQIAYDAFHQDDFETALLHFKSAELSPSSGTNPDFFLAVTYFLMGNYPTALSQMYALIGNRYAENEKVLAFIDECSRRVQHAIAENKAEVVPVPMQYTNTIQSTVFVKKRILNDQQGVCLEIQPI